METVHCRKCTVLVWKHDTVSGLCWRCKIREQSEQIKKLTEELEAIKADRLRQMPLWEREE